MKNLQANTNESMKRAVDRGWHWFFKSRGLQPPWVSSKQLGVFNMVKLQSKGCTDGSNKRSKYKSETN